MRELELLLKLADATEVEFFRGLIRDMRSNFGDKETLDILDDVCGKLSEINSPSVKELIKETQKNRDLIMIRGEWEKWNEAKRQQREQEQKVQPTKGPWRKEQWQKWDQIKKRGWEW
ncbi:MAG: hypothetical protein QQN63_04995 [Nitrosopumilus sp.]